MAIPQKKMAFDKVRSAVERRHLFEQALQEKSIFTCKLDEEDLIHFSPIEMQHGTNLVCQTSVVPKSQGVQQALGNFAVGEDRYFFNGPLTVKGAEITLSVQVDVFKLERRKTLRVPIPADLSISVNIIDINGRPGLRSASIADISAGGLRLYFPQNPTGDWLPKDAKLKGVLHLPSAKTLQFDGEVRHTQKIEMNGVEVMHFGIEFGACREANTPRMITLTFEIQRRLISE